MFLFIYLFISWGARAGRVGFLNIFDLKNMIETN
jgi:hypothetical protein